MTAARLATLALVSLPFIAGGSAQAANFEVQPLLAGQSFSFEQTGSAFSDQLSFKIGEPLDFSVNFTNLGLGSNASLSVFLGSTEIVGTFGRNITWAWGPFSKVPAFAPGTEFQVKVSGTDSTIGDAAYHLSLFSSGTGGIAPVPEVPTWGLLAAGLALVGTIARRRVRGNSS